MDFFAELGLKMNKEKGHVYKNFPSSFLIQKSIEYGHGALSEDGSLVVLTGKHTGRSAKDKYVVKSPSTVDSIWWENSLNEMSKENFEALKIKALNYLNEDDRDVFISTRSVGAERIHNLGVRTVTTHPHHALFTKHLFRGTIRKFTADDYLILHVPEMDIDPNEFGAHSKTIITTCFDSKVTIITGSLYAGEIKKSMFSIMNYILPEKNVLPMHSGANKLKNGEVSVFFGLSGTGKTTLSTDVDTLLIGDDEHGLSDEGIFNFEGGCYAKTYKLSSQTEPGIYKASNQFGAILENVVLNDKTGHVDFFDKSVAENGRSSYPLPFIEGLEKTSTGDVPKHIFFLTADAFGVLPPVSKLTQEQAMFYFVLGYTAKLAGTEIGVKEPQATFSSCFGAPFMLRHPREYAKLLGHYLEKYNIQVWLINTGWTGGSFGVGQRFPLHVTREIIRTIQAGKLDHMEMKKDPIFGLSIPKKVNNVAPTLLNPRKNWEDGKKYDEVAETLAKSFHQQMVTFGDFYKENINGAPTYNGQ
jgi:phosphoenolpyruvate carboxykinase (ATP)